MFSSVPRIAGLLAATSLALASLATAAHAQTGAQGRPDATNVQMVSIGDTYCRSIDNTDMTGQDYYFSAADVTAKSGKVIQSHNGGSCCTAAAPWNGSACQAVPTCTNDKDLIGWSCVATADSCARVGMTLINGACGVAPTPPSCNISSVVGKYTKYGEGNAMAVDPNAESYRVLNSTTMRLIVPVWAFGGGTTWYYAINLSNCTFNTGGGAKSIEIRSGGLFLPGTPEYGIADSMLYWVN